MSYKALVVIRREFMERVKKKSFWISTFLLPIIMLGMMFLPAVFMSMSVEKELRVAVIDHSGTVFEFFKENINRKTKSSASTAQKNVKKTTASDFEDFDTTQVIAEKIDPKMNNSNGIKTLKQKIAEKQLDGLLVISSNIDLPDSFVYYGRNVSNIKFISRLERALDPLLLQHRLARDKINASPEQVMQWVKGASVQTYQVDTTGTSKKSGFETAMVFTFGFVMILYVSLIIYGIANLRGIMEEKTNRVMEVLLSFFSPTQLMTGKLMGIGLVGLVQIGMYALTAGVIVLYGTLASAGVSPEVRTLLQAVNPMWFFWFVIFFVLGYFINSAMFLGIGSLCSSEEDAQNLQGIAIAPIVIPMVSAFFFISHPDSTIAVIVSMIPIFTPMVMLMRITTLTPPLWQVLLSIGICLVFLRFQLWAVAKVFRIGVLSYGKRPSFKEVWQWIRSE